MKGITDVEFILSVVIFLTVVIFVTFTIVSKIPGFRLESIDENLRDTAYSISELLINDLGEPANFWSLDDVKRIGLNANSSYVLDDAKISSFNTLCSAPEGYANAKSLLGLSRIDFRISMIDSEGLEILRCSPQLVTESRSQFQLVRFATLKSNRDIVKLTVDVF